MTNLSLEPGGSPSLMDLSQPPAPPAFGPRPHEESFNRHLNRASRDNAAPSEAKQTPASDRAAPPATSDAAEEASEDQREPGDQQGANGAADAEAAGAATSSDEPSGDGDEEPSTDEVIVDVVEITSDVPQPNDGAAQADPQQDEQSDDAHNASTLPRKSAANANGQAVLTGTQDGAPDAVQASSDSQTGSPTDAIATALGDEVAVETETKGEDSGVVNATKEGSSDEDQQRRAAQLAKSADADRKRLADGESDDSRRTRAEEIAGDRPPSGPSKSPSANRGRQPASTQEQPPANLQAVASGEPAATAPVVNPAAADRALGESASGVASLEEQPPPEAPAVKPASSPSEAPDARANPPGRTALERIVGQAAKPNGEPSTPDGINRVQFVQRVARAVRLGTERGGEVRLRLAPPELGSVRLEVVVDRGVLAARLETETPMARAILLDNMPALRERLAEHDIKIGRFDVDLMDQSGEDVREDPADDARWNREQRQRSSAHEPSQPDSKQSPESATPRSPNTDGELNVVI